MSNYGADDKADLNVATESTKTQGLIPYDKTWVSQHTYAAGIFVQRYASRQGMSNVLVKYEKP